MFPGVPLKKPAIEEGEERIRNTIRQIREGMCAFESVCVQP